MQLQMEAMMGTKTKNYYTICFDLNIDRLGNNENKI